MSARLTGHKIKGLTDRQDNPEIKRHSLFFACGAGNGLQVVGNIRLRPLVKFHIGMDREGVEAFLADAPPVTVGSHEPFIDGEAGLFAHGALDRVQAPFDFLRSPGLLTLLSMNDCAGRIGRVAFRSPGRSRCRAAREIDP